MFTIFQKSTWSYLRWMTHTSLRKYKQSGTNSSSRYQILQYTWLSFVSLSFTPVITGKVPLSISEFNFSVYTLGPLPFSLKDFNSAIAFLFLLHCYFFSLHWIISIFTHTCSSVSHLWNSSDHINNFSWLHVLLQLQTYISASLPINASQKNDLSLLLSRFLLSFALQLCLALVHTTPLTLFSLRSSTTFVLPNTVVHF